jgi:hypothetical protein
MERLIISFLILNSQDKINNNYYRRLYENEDDVEIYNLFNRTVVEKIAPNVVFKLGSSINTSNEDKIRLITDGVYKLFKEMDNNTGIKQKIEKLIEQHLDSILESAKSIRTHTEFKKLDKPRQTQNGGKIGKIKKSVKRNKQFNKRKTRGKNKKIRRKTRGKNMKRKRRTMKRKNTN